MRSWMTDYFLGAYVIFTLFCLHTVVVTSLPMENKCMRHYFVGTIRHPRKHCESKNVLLARCEGYCSQSRTNPRVTFSPVLQRPFRRQCTCCRDALSVMKAVALSCRSGEVIFATYRYIVRCGCHYCGSSG